MPKTVKKSVLGSVFKPRQDQPPHLEVQALAGTGKTTTVIEGIKVLKGFGSNLTPSTQQAEVWKAMGLGKNDSIRVSAFSSKITEELKSRLDRFGLDKIGVEAKGIHSLGLTAVTKRFGRVSLDESDWVVQDLTADILGVDLRRSKSKEIHETIRAVDALVSLCKQTLSSPNEEVLDQLSSRFDVDLGTQKDRIYQLVPDVLHECLEPVNRITFDDAIWLPIRHDLRVPKVDCQIIDESQDLNRMQQELMFRAGHRIMFVGDEHQAIFGFAGADADSMVNMRGRLAQEKAGVTQIPLTVTRRCGRAIVGEAKRFVPEYEAHESNPEGLVSHASMVEGDRCYRKTVQAGDFILCRINAPLISQCFRFIRDGRKAVILGKKIGEGLTSLITKSKAQNVPDLISWVDDWLSNERANEQAKKRPSQGRLANLQDRRDCLVAMCEGLSQVEDVSRKVQSIFTEDKDSKGVILASIHRSKGLEARRVHLLAHELRTEKMQPWEVQQEINLKYVAITRAINELVYVS